MIYTLFFFALFNCWLQKKLIPVHICTSYLKPTAALFRFMVFKQLFVSENLWLGYLCLFRRDQRIDGCIWPVGGGFICITMKEQVSAGMRDIAKQDFHRRSLLVCCDCQVCRGLKSKHRWILANDCRSYMTKHALTKIFQIIAQTLSICMSIHTYMYVSKALSNLPLQMMIHFAAFLQWTFALCFWFYHMIQLTIVMP